MSSLVLLVPGSVETLTGGYGYDRRMVAGLRERGWSVTVRELDRSFPYATPAAKDDAAEALAEIPDGSLVLVDGLALGALPDEAAHEAARLRLVALVHHPLAAETGLEPHVARQLRASERDALAAVGLVVVTSRATAAAMASYGVGVGRVAVVEPGTDKAPLAGGSQSSVRNLLCVATLVPRKGHAVLMQALAEIPQDDWILTCVGSQYRSPATVRRLRAQIEDASLDEHVRLVGEVDAPTLAGYYDSADLFVLPTLHEGYGMAIAEALAHGLPVVSTPTGAIPDLVGDDAGILVPPGDVEGLTAALWRVLEDAALRDRLREGARRVRARLPTWAQQSAKLAGVLDRAGGHGRV